MFQILSRLIAASGLLVATASPGEEVASAARYASADLERAQLLYTIQCQACHSLEADGPNQVGPTLHGIVGREAASAPGFDRFSAALKGSGITWTPEVLERWLERPSALVPGNTMAFIGIPKEQDRINLVAYLMRQEQ